VPLPSAPPDVESVLAALDPEQREVALAPRGPVCVLAGAGTGKTRALTHRIAYLAHSGQVSGSHVLAVTFTARAAGELRTRLRGLGVEGVQARTFHSAALRQLRYFWPSVVGGEPPQVIAAKAQPVAEAASRCRLRPDRSTVRDVAAEIEWAKVSQVAPDDYAAAARVAGRPAPGELSHETVGQVYATYEQVKRDRGVIDFEDVLLLAAGMLADDDAMATSVRSQYRSFLVDEYQDVSPAQQRLLELWLGERDDLTVVGDASQTIYSFTGATPSFLLGFKQHYPTAEVVKLVRNYRSTPQIVATANKVMAAASGNAARLRLELVSQREAGPTPTYSELPDEPAEAAAVAASIQQLSQDGVALRDMAILFRINAQSEVYEEALSRLAVPYVVRGGERFFDRSEVRDGITLLRGAARAGETSDDLSSHVAAVLATAGYRPEPPAGPGAARNRWESLAALVSLAAELAAERPDATLTDLVQELEHRANAQHAPVVEGVTLASLHAAKGLEWEAVFVVGMVDGTLPITYAQTTDQVEEERRLFYVGVTRARRHLGLSWALSRTPGGRGSRRPSRFLDVSRSTDVKTVGKSPGKRRRTASCVSCGRALTTPLERKLRHCSHCEVSVDLALFEQLREWRKKVADEASVPAYVIFTDATLTAIAQDKPTDEAGLAAIPGIGRTKIERYAAAVIELVVATS
jgi:DNA helicase-2/ATP-dependent DNA helicase PcrA